MFSGEDELIEDSGWFAILLGLGICFCFWSRECIRVDLVSGIEVLRRIYLILGIVFLGS